jgi:hypothetical protein
MFQKENIDLTTFELESAYFTNFLPDEKFTKRVNPPCNEEISRAIPDQRLHLHKSIPKYIMLNILSYLESNKICSVVKSNKRSYLMLIKEDYLNTILVDSYLKGFYFRQFTKPRPDILDDIFCFGSGSTNLTGMGKSNCSKKNQLTFYGEE